MRASRGGAGPTDCAGTRRVSGTGPVATIVVAILVVAVLLVSMLGAVLFGSADLTPSTVLAVLAHELLGRDSPEVTHASVQIIWNLRLPRAILAIAAGGGLATCGTAMQAITQNELADPYILGVSGGASAMASLAFFLGGIFSTTVVVQLFAFAGAILSLVIVYVIGMGGHGGSGTRLVLAGMAVSIVTNAIAQLFISLSSTATSRNITMWLMGSLASARWDNIAPPLVASLAGLAFFFALSRAYNLISLGDETAVGQGVNTERIKKATGIVVAFVCGAMVSFCGVIGLVGFVVPHAVRIVVGSGHRRLFPISYLVGSVFLVWMDLLARFVMSPQELPVGVFTALCGGPFFVFLLYRQTRLRGRG